MKDEAVSWVVYLMTLRNQPEGVKAVCAQNEWEKLERDRPGYHKLIQAGIATETEAEILAERLALRGRLLQVAGIVGEAVRPSQAHPLTQAPMDGAGLVVGEVHSRPGAQQVEDAGQFLGLIGGESRRERRRGT